MSNQDQRIAELEAELALVKSGRPWNLLNQRIAELEKQLGSFLEGKNARKAWLDEFDRCRNDVQKMAALLDKVPHDYESNLLIDGVTHTHCHDDCLACQWEKLKSTK